MLLQVGQGKGQGQGQGQGQGRGERSKEGQGMAGLRAEAEWFYPFVIIGCGNVHMVLGGWSRLSTLWGGIPIRPP